MGNKNKKENNGQASNKVIFKKIYILYKKWDKKLRVLSHHVLEEKELLLIDVLQPKLLDLLPGEQAGTRVSFVDGLGQQGSQLLGI